ncbi:MAG: inosine/guanosine kinase [Deltaproteobacteria bacterium]|nr:MAG: inosine/guanosine kinase [Deltaproteobacteria bacterium]
MKFPGQRKQKHYFPVDTKKQRTVSKKSTEPAQLQRQIYIVGIGQPLVDVEVHAEAELLERYGIKSGESLALDSQTGQALYQELKERELVRGEFAGGAIGNTLHNYTVLSNNRGVLLGCINRNITVGDYAYTYLCHTSSLVDLSYLMPCNTPMGRAICFISNSGERSFAIDPGCINDLTVDYVPEHVIQHSSLLLLTAFLLRSEDNPIFASTMHALSLAKKHGIPVVLNLGTSFLIEQRPSFWQDLLREYVNVVAMNEAEAFALTGQSDPLLALQDTLRWCDMALLTHGPKGLYLGGYCDREALRQTSRELESSSIPEYNRYEYSRAMRREDCESPVAIYSHINPYEGGPAEITTTNGAGDAALSAVLHDISANDYHHQMVPNSPKHRRTHLTYSSISQIAKYANRVSYEVLSQNSPRLMYGLPEREDSLEESYWDL